MNTEAEIEIFLSGLQEDKSFGLQAPQRKGQRSMQGSKDPLFGTLITRITYGQFVSGRQVQSSIYTQRRVSFTYLSKTSFVLYAKLKL